MFVVSPVEENEPVGRSPKNALSRLRVGINISSGIANPAIRVTVATTSTESLQTLIERAVKECRHRRGGEALVISLLAGASLDDALNDAVTKRHLYLAMIDEELGGFAFVRDRIICSLYVEHTKRRQGVARQIVTTLLGVDGLVLDALALPGDRATKSLYESIGWKARLLTMRAE